MKVQEQKPAPIANPAKSAAPTSQYPCTVDEESDGTLTVTFTITPQTAKRLKSKAYSQPMDVFIYENILKRAVEGSAF